MGNKVDVTTPKKNITISKENDVTALNVSAPGELGNNVTESNDTKISSEVEEKDNLIKRSERSLRWERDGFKNEKYCRNQNTDAEGMTCRKTT